MFSNRWLLCLGLLKQLHHQLKKKREFDCNDDDNCSNSNAFVVNTLIRPSKPKKLKSRGTEKYVGPVIGGYQTECPFCKGIVYVSDQKVDGMFRTGIFGPIDCGGTS